MGFVSIEKNKDLNYDFVIQIQNMRVHDTYIMKHFYNITRQNKNENVIFSVLNNNKCKK